MPGPNRHTEGLLEHADVVASTTATNGEIRVNLGDAVKGTGIDRNVPFWGIDGFLSRPLNPDADGAAQYLFFADGNQRYAIGSRDRRFFTGLETIDVGDRMIYAPSGIRIRLDDSEQAIETSIPGGTKHYVSSDLAFIAIANGATLEIGLSTIDVTKLGVAEPVALYAKLQTAAFALNAYVVAAQVLLVKIPTPPTVPELAALNSAYSAFLTAVFDLMNPALASSSVLRASPT